MILEIEEVKYEPQDNPGVGYYLLFLKTKPAVTLVLVPLYETCFPSFAPKPFS